MENVAPWSRETPKAKLLRVLQETPGGLTRTDISHLLRRPSEEIVAILTELLAENRVTMVREETGKRGRVAERWFVVCTVPVRRETHDAHNDLHN